LRDTKHNYIYTKIDSQNQNHPEKYYYPPELESFKHKERDSEKKYVSKSYICKIQLKNTRIRIIAVVC